MANQAKNALERRHTRAHQSDERTTTLDIAAKGIRGKETFPKRPIKVKFSCNNKVNINISTKQIKAANLKKYACAIKTKMTFGNLSTGLKRMSAGLNLCHENSQEIFDQRPDLDFIQIHPEHLLQEKGGTYREHLDTLRHHYPIILHGFGLSIGSSGPLDKEYLQLIRDLLKEHPEAVFSDHFSWSSLSKHHFHDLIPLIQTDETVQYMVERIDEAQEIIGAPILLENISSYMRYKESEMSEIEFINEITKRSGCYVLLDVNNIWANAMNFGEDPWQSLNEINPNSIKGYHLAGCTEEQKGNGKVYIDYHGEAVHEEVWDLYSRCLETYGPWPTLLEWENNIPPLNRTLQEVEKITACFEKLEKGANS